MSARKIGFTTRAKAQEAARRASPQGYVVQLADGSFVGVGDVLLCNDGTRDRLFYGAYGVTGWLSEAANDFKG